MNFRHLFIPKDKRLYELYTSVYSYKTRGYMNFRHLFIPKRQEVI